MVNGVSKFDSGTSLQRFVIELGIAARSAWGYVVLDMKLLPLKLGLLRCNLARAGLLL
jgi:hypothetical protein